MPFTNAKRKLDGGGRDDRSYSKSRKRNLSDDAPLSSINHQAAIEHGSRSTHGMDGIANTFTKTTNASGTSPVKKTQKLKSSSDQTSDSSADEASKMQSLKPKKNQMILQKQRTSSSESSSLNQDNVSVAEPKTKEGMGATSKVALPASSIPRTEGAPGEAKQSEDEEDDEHIEEDEDNADSDPSSEDSLESSSDASLYSSDDPPIDPKKKEIKADNPNAFASSMAGILGSKLTSTQRANPILARSAAAKEADETLLDRKLERKAKAELKKQKSNTGSTNLNSAHQSQKAHGAQDPTIDPTRNPSGTQQDPPNHQEEEMHESVSANPQLEKELRKMAQRGVVKMFNAFASVRQKAVEAQGSGGSRAKREERATEMSKESWLEFVGQGGKGVV